MKRNPLNFHFLRGEEWGKLLRGRAETRRIAKRIGVRGGKRRQAVNAYTQGFLGEARRMRKREHKRGH